MNFMKPLLNVLFCLLLASTSVWGQESFSFSFEEPFGSVNASQTPTIVSPLPKSARLRSDRGGNLLAVFDSSVSDLCKAIIENAISLWSEQLYFPNDNVVKINFSFSQLGTDIAYKVDDVYFPIGDKIYTQIYARVNNNGIPEGEIKITFNNRPNMWYFEGDQDGVQNKYDFKTATLRAIAQLLGFKSTLSNMPFPRFNYGTYNGIVARSPYDYNVINSNNKVLASIQNGQDAELSQYVTGNNVYWKYPNTGYKIYAPSTFKQGLSMDYFDSQGELMSYDFKSNECIWRIDDKVLQVLKDIGWQTQNDALKINCSTIDQSGIANAYNSYYFHRFCEWEKHYQLSMGISDKEK
jgi:hypothetical protein